MEKMEETLHTIPGLEAEISQPIQMRNNELLTGIKQDVAIKIFGDDPDELTKLGEHVGKMISGIQGSKWNICGTSLRFTADSGGI